MMQIFAEIRCVDQIYIGIIVMSNGQNKNNVNEINVEYRTVFLKHIYKRRRES